MSRTTHHVPWRQRVDARAAATCTHISVDRCAACRGADPHTEHAQRTLRRRRARAGESVLARDGLVAEQVETGFAVWSYRRAFRDEAVAALAASYRGGQRTAERAVLEELTGQANAALRARADVAEHLGDLDGFVPPPASALAW